jgi:hypothetical protein
MIEKKKKKNGVEARAQGCNKTEIKRGGKKSYFFLIYFIFLISYV